MLDGKNIEISRQKTKKIARMTRVKNLQKIMKC
jgi:hypothetical protein